MSNPNQLSDGTVAGFAAALAKLKEAGGGPSLGAISTKTGVAKSVLSAAFKGESLPSRRTVSAIATALDIDPAPWVAERDRVETEIKAAAAEPAKKRRWPRLHLLTAIGMAVVLMCAASVVTGLVVHSRTQAADTKKYGPTIDMSKVHNGADPVQAGCAGDARVYASQDFAAPGVAKKNYQVQIRYSPKCNAEWARVSRWDAAEKGHKMHIELHDYRNPAVKEVYETGEFSTIYTNIMLRTGIEGFCTSGWIEMPDGEPKLELPQICG